MIVDTLHPDDNHTSLQNIYKSYCDVSTPGTRVNLSVLLLLLNTCDR